MPANSSSGEGFSLRTRQVRKTFPAPDNSGARTVALADVSLDVDAGNLVSVIGPSGCGKSTLLRLIAGLEIPDSGELKVGDESITGPAADRGLVFQDPNLFPWLTVRRNIQAGLVARGLLHKNRREADDLIRLVGLDAFADAYPHHLSGGMAQRVALARALINHPRVLLLDEPLGALDAFTRMRMQDEVLRLWQARRTTMLLVTHDIDEAIYMSDRIVIMTPRPGRIERIIDVPLSRPRQRNSPEFLKLRSDILEQLHFTGDQNSAPGTPYTAISTEREPSLVRSNINSATNVEPSAAMGVTPRCEPGTSRASVDTQVIIIGGGPAGSTLGAYLARAKIDHIIVDQAVHPRPHVGESLVCSTTRSFQDSDFRTTM